MTSPTLPPRAPTTADELRRAFLEFFEARGHTVLSSSSLIPNDPTLLLTTAGMVQFKPYMLGEEPPPWPRATTVQKCFRTTDIDIIGTTTRHLTFFEMLGNFCLGDYFKDRRHPLRLGAGHRGASSSTPSGSGSPSSRPTTRPARSGATRSGCPPSASSGWAKRTTSGPWGPPGPAGPARRCTTTGAPSTGAEGGPAHGGAERYVEFWNLVFMQYNRQADGTLDRPAPQNIDTGAGLERMPGPAAGRAVGLRDRRAAPHPRRGRGRSPGAATAPTRRPTSRCASWPSTAGPSPSWWPTASSPATRAAATCCAASSAAPSATPACSGSRRASPARWSTPPSRPWAAPTPTWSASTTSSARSSAREEARFAETLRRGLELLDELLGKGDVSGDDAFYLHDTLGFPVEVTAEIAGERGRAVDLDGFVEQHGGAATPGPRLPRGGRPRPAAREGRRGAPVLRDVVESDGETEFTGYREAVTTGPGRCALATDGETTLPGRGGQKVDVVLDRTPFYAESGGQVGDTGIIETGRRDAAGRSTPSTASPARSPLHRCEVVERPRGHRRRGRRPASTWTAGSASAATTRPPTFCTGRLREVLGRAREAGRVAGLPRPAALRLLPLRGVPLRRPGPGRDAGQRARC